MVMIRKTFFITVEDAKSLEKLNDKLNEEEDTELKLSTRIRKILKQYLKENNK